MKSTKGFNLVELMVALAISSSIIWAIFNAYANLSAKFIYNSKVVELQRDLQLAMALIKHDLYNAGVFGSFSFHHQSINSYFLLRNTSLCRNYSCNFDENTIGVRSFDANVRLDGLSANPVSGSEWLRIQFGDAKVAYLSDYSLEGNYFRSLTFDNPQNMSATKSVMLVSANRAYQFHFHSNLPQMNNKISFDIYKFFKLPVAQSYDHVNRIVRDPDQFSLQLVNFYTKYYYIGEHNGVRGLYALEVLSGGAVPQLISPLITQLTFNYKVDITNEVNKVPATTNRYSDCTTSAMNSNTICANKWRNINTMSIELTAGDSVDLSNQPFNQVLSQRLISSVSW